MNGKKNRVKHYARAAPRYTKRKPKDIPDIIPSGVTKGLQKIQASLNVNSTLSIKRAYISKLSLKPSRDKNKSIRNIDNTLRNMINLVANINLENHISKYKKKYITKVLMQTDFSNGTYRITNPGLYKLGENIEFNPKPINPANNDKNYPNEKDPEGGVGPYILGFFAAITIECKDVILDLNGKTLLQSKEHCLKQRFFSLIELANSPFISKQGPAKFLTEDNKIKSANTCLIMNGTLGRSSHHGIHGNLATGVCICNVVIKDFEVGGIHLNGSSNTILYNILVGHPAKPPVLSRYSQSKFMLDTLNDAHKAKPDTTILGTPIIKIYQKLKDAIEKTELAFLKNKGSMSPLFYDKSLEIGSDAQVYGIVLNVNGVAVNELADTRNVDSIGNRDIFIYNVKIIGIKSAAKEIIALSKTSGISLPSVAYGTEIQAGIRGAVVDIVKIIGEDGKYKRNIFTDAILAIEMVFGFGKLSDSFINWALSEEKFDTIAMKSVDEGGLYFKKGGDSMAHIMKGTIALFISCGENIFGEYITIEQPKNIVIEEVGVEELKKKAVIVESAHPGRAQEAYSIVYTGCSNVDLQKITILQPPEKKLQRLQPFLFVDKKYITKINTTVIQSPDESLKFNIRKIQEFNYIQNDRINYIHSDDLLDNTNLNTTMQFIVK